MKPTAGWSFVQDRYGRKALAWLTLAKVCEEARQVRVVTKVQSWPVEVKRRKSAKIVMSSRFVHPRSLGPRSQTVPYDHADRLKGFCRVMR